MSPRVVATSYSTIIILGLVGVWLGSVAVDSTDMRRWVGLATLLAAVVGLVVMYLCHVRPTKHETEIAWKQTWSRGRLRFVLRQVLVSQVVWFPILFGAAYELYKTRSLTALSAPSRWWYVIAPVTLFSVLFGRWLGGIVRKKNTDQRRPHNKSLDASGGSVFRIMIGPAMLE